MEVDARLTTTEVLYFMQNEIPVQFHLQIMSYFGLRTFLVDLAVAQRSFCYFHCDLEKFMTIRTLATLKIIGIMLASQN